MHIQKINDNKLEIFIGTKDLVENNITVQDFMSSSYNRHNFLLNILNYASKETDFDYKNCNVVLESFSIPTIRFIYFCYYQNTL